MGSGKSAEKAEDIQLYWLIFIFSVNLGENNFFKYASYILLYTYNSYDLELSVFWPFDTESRINELRFSESISLSFKTRLTSVSSFCGDVT